jgi:uncharacterized protein (TIGR02453 family)
MKSYFNKGYLEFFMDLAANNNKEWFDKNRARYIKDVKQPFEDFTAVMIEKLKKPEELGDTKPSDCIFRINRDIRFSKDKTPYKLQMSAAFSKGGKKDMVSPGLYVELGPEHLGIYTGVYMPEKDILQQVRAKIASNMKKFETIVNAPAFKKAFGEVKGEKAKLLPPDLKEKAKVQPLILNKQFYVMHTHDPAIILKDKLIDHILKTYEAASDFNAFLKSAL